MSRRRTYRAEPEYSLNPSGGKILLDKTYIGFVKDNRDAIRMGRLRVWIPEISSDPSEESSWVTVNYMSPFAGATLVDDNKTSGEKFEDTQKSYGWWFIPPDLENEVVCVFINGDPSRGIWIGCLYNQLMNHMVPGIATGKSFGDPTKKNERPVSEYNKKSNVPISNPRRPTYDPLFLGLQRQGLTEDMIRGQSSSSARRESPSRVGGILTPRGNHLVMDDGFTDPEAEIQKKSQGFGVKFDKNTTPSNHSDIFPVRSPTNKNFRRSELIRFRTRSGTQVLISETEGMVYIISRDGNSWMEVSNEGYVDIYGFGDISIRSEKNINIRADRDVNLEAGRDVNIKASKDFRFVPRDEGDTVEPGSGEGGNVNIEAVSNLSTKSGSSTFITSDTDYHVNVAGSSLFNTDGNYDNNIKGITKINIDKDYHKKVGGKTFLETIDTLDETIGGQRTVKIGGSDYKKVEQTETSWIKHTADVQGTCPIDTPIMIDCDQTPTLTSKPTIASIVGNLPTAQISDKELVTTGEFNQIQTISIVERLPHHEPYEDHDSVFGTRNKVAEDSKIDERGIKSGSISPSAKKPLPVEGTVNGQTGKFKGTGYDKDGKPMYEKIGDATQKNTCSMNISERGIDFIAQKEGNVLTVYKDSAGLDTIGIGHLITNEEKESGTININGTPTNFKSGITKQQSRDLFKQDIKKFERGMCRIIKVPLNQNQYDALISWMFNVGQGNAGSSTLVRKLNQGDYADVPKNLQAWNKVTVRGRKQVSEGLSNRRRAEAIKFTSTEGTTRIA